MCFSWYSRIQKGYRCYSPTLQHHFISANVTFDESQSYFSPSIASDSSPPCLPLLPPVSPIESPQKLLQVYCRQQRPPTETSTPPSDPTPDPASLLIALRKVKRSCTSHPISVCLLWSFVSISLCLYHILEFYYCP